MLTGSNPSENYHLVNKEHSQNSLPLNRSIASGVYKTVKEQVIHQWLYSITDAGVLSDSE